MTALERKATEKVIEELGKQLLAIQKELTDLAVSPDLMQNHQFCAIGLKKYEQMKMIICDIICGNELLNLCTKLDYIALRVAIRGQETFLNQSNLLSS